MKTFGFNRLEDMVNIEIEGDYDAEKQMWVGSADSFAGSTSSSCSNGQCVTDDDPNGGSTFTSVRVINGRFTFDQRTD